MKLSNRDKKLFLVLLIVIVLVVPMFLIFKPMFEKTKELKESNEKLQARVDELKDLYDKTDYYLECIEEMKTIEGGILKKFDQGLAQENSIMFIRNEAERIPFVVTSLNFGEMIESTLRPVVYDENGEMTDGLVYLERQTSIEFDATYDQFKQFLKSIQEQPEKMTLVGVNAKYQDKNGRLEGLFILEQYAFVAPNRPYDDIPIPALEHGNIDKGGIFGNYIEDEEIRKEVFPESEDNQDAE